MLIPGSYFSHGIAYLPHARRIPNDLGLLQGGITNCQVPPSDIINLLLSTSRFGVIQSKLDSVTQAKILSKDLDDPYICMLVASRESSVLRMNGEPSRSDEVLQNAMSKYLEPDGSSNMLLKEARCNALVGKLLQSRAENLISLDDLEQAQHELSKWGPIKAASPSSMEKTVQVSIALTLGRLAKIQGHFEASLGQLTPLLERIDAEDIATGGWRRVLLALIGEVYCELGRPANAQSVLIPQINCLKLSKSHNTSSGLRLQLALAESYLQGNSHNMSRELAENVRCVLENAKQYKQHSSISKKFYLRAWTILARSAHIRGDWDEALNCWKQGLKVLDLIHESTGSSAAIVELSIADLLRKKGHVEASIEEETLARHHMNHERARRYHFTGFDSYWRDSIVSELSQAAKPAMIPIDTPDNDLRMLKV